MEEIAATPTDRPASGIEAIVKLYVKLGNLVALSKQKIHRLKLLAQHENRGSEFSIELLRKDCQNDIAAIDAGIRELLQREDSRGHVDMCSPERIAGWAQYVRYPELPVTLGVFRDQKLATRILANRFRLDLQKAKLGSGEHGFEFIPPKEFFVGAELIQVKVPNGSVIGEYRPPFLVSSDVKATISLRA